MIWVPSNRNSTTAFHVYAISSINRVGKFHWISHGPNPPKFICMRCPGRYASAQKFQNEFPPTRTVFVFISSRKNEKHFSKKNKNIQIEITLFCKNGSLGYREEARALRFQAVDPESRRDPPPLRCPVRLLNYRSCKCFNIWSILWSVYLKHQKV